MLSSRYALNLTKKEFAEKAGHGHIPPLYVKIPYHLSPEKIYPLFSGRHSFLFESIKGPEKIARYSFIGFDPHLVIRAKDGLVEIEHGSIKSLTHGRPLNYLRDILGNYSQMPSDELPPFQGGAAGLLSYDFVHYLERLPMTTPDDLRIPDAHLCFIDRLIAFDHRDRKAWVIVCPGLRNKASDAAASFDEAGYLLEDICRRVESLTGPEAFDLSAHRGARIEVVDEMRRQDYTDMVKKAKEYIAAGDIFQANLSQRVTAFIGERRPWDLYRILREVNPSPFAGFVDFGDYQIVSSSPERLVRVRDRIIETRPIAGTRPRGKDSREDEKMRDDLLLNEKERAEHIMLIDLERNDLGRVSDYGTIEADEFMITEDYSHVIHIVSNIKGRLAGNKTSLDALKALFPGGTITGVPKVRCMEIIDELEPVRRGPYTGSMGYIGFSGNMDMNIIIRSFVVKDSYAYVQAGAGIVADSDPEREYHETIKKAGALIKTLEM